MDLVLGVSMTSAAVRWVLVEGITGEGATISRGSFDLAEAVDPDDLLDVLLIDEPDSRMHAIGLTWTNEATDAASGVLEAVRARGYDNVIAVSELEAGDVLASGIAGIADYEDVAVCIVEPDAAVVAIVNSRGVTVDRFSRPSDGSDVVELPSSVMAMLDLDDWQPDSIFVVGSAEDLDLIKTTLEAVTDAPVFSAAEADLALARGAALASARAVNGLETPETHKPSPVRALTAVLVAAAVTLVVSLSVALGLSLSPSVPEQPHAANPEPTAEEPAPPGRQSGTKVANLTESLKAARPVVAQTIVVAAPSAPPASAFVPPAAPVNTPPAYSPPVPTYAPPPAYVPPVAPQPRLRDRILERIPIINRFHEPEYQYPN
ncbi:DUF7159 family protein [Mycobacterium neglectum]|jgi:hypothetical protein|uniref:DUF7159 family protein n=1 Tax=Mycobacterium neglectum TaxID=242737 RepID=UPI000BFEBEE4|nr:hypothetical protein [Mycobacterium neglectum]